MNKSDVIKLSGKASVDKPWLKFYPEPFVHMEVPKMSLEDFLKNNNPDDNKYAIEYYGCKYTWKQLWAEVDLAAKALRSVGFKEGDRVPVFLQAVPAYYVLLLAAEKIGAALICREDTPEELCFTMRKTTASTVFMHDYISKEEEEMYRTTTPIKQIVKISPYDYACKEEIPDYIEEEIMSRYSDTTVNTGEYLSWADFLKLGSDFEGDYIADKNPDRPLFGAYTSGSTGVSKLVIHSAANMVAVAFQMSMFALPTKEQETWWLPVLPPALIAVTVATIIFPLSVGMRIVLDPFCPLDDIDVRFMTCKPNYWALIPMFCDILMKSKRIPEEYDMSHLRNIGTGAEPMNERKSREVEDYFHRHKCTGTLSAGYGQSEGCSNFTLPNPLFPLHDGCVGMPMPATVIAIFNPSTYEEMGYGEIGEVCMNGPAKMLHYGGYNASDLTERTLVTHPDGTTWLHTGDSGYITEHGIIHILGRGRPKRFGGGDLFMMRMESRVVETSGVKDAFFCFVPDRENEGFFVPYLYVVLDEGECLENVKMQILKKLEPHEYPVEIRVIKERPYFHFKLNRKELIAEILEKNT